jgi:hypothetical protein
MFLGIDWEPIMPAITAVLVLGTVAIGIAGLFSDSHTKRGKLTRSGWRVAALMVVLGIFTFLSGLANQKIADAKERKLAAERTRQFQAQIGTLRSVTGRLGGVSGSLSELQSNMGESLRTQRGLFSKADANLRISGALQRQSQADTRNLLRGMFEESNRITPERVAVSVDYSCEAPVHPPSYPDVKGVQVAIEGDHGTELSLVSTVSTRVSDEIVFQNFLSELGRYESFEAWRNARVRIRITGSPKGPILPIPNHSVEDGPPHLQIQPQRCPMLVRLYLNGREMIEKFGYFEPTERVDPLFYLLEFEDLRVDPNRLPRFIK